MTKNYIIEELNNIISNNPDFRKQIEKYSESEREKYLFSFINKYSEFKLNNFVNAIAEESILSILKKDPELYQMFFSKAAEKQYFQNYKEDIINLSKILKNIQKDEAITFFDVYSAILLLDIYLKRSYLIKLGNDLFPKENKNRHIKANEIFFEIERVFQYKRKEISSDYGLSLFKNKRDLLEKILKHFDSEPEIFNKSKAQKTFIESSKEMKNFDHSILPKLLNCFDISKNKKSISTGKSKKMNLIFDILPILYPERYSNNHYDSINYKSRINAVKSVFWGSSKKVLNG